ncbi:hypothetical protein N7490_001647 [Penicillium lividum]|nr:hypothetical protein N7490_001647 [Penicillium lividum]
MVYHVEDGYKHDLTKPPPPSKILPILFLSRLDAEHSIAFAAMEMKRRFDSSHRPIHFKVGDYVLLKLGDGYNIPANHRLPTKLGQRYVGRFKVLKRIGRLAYKLDLPPNRKIHPVISVAHLEPASRPTTPQAEQVRSLPAAPSRSTVNFADFSPIRLPYTQVPPRSKYP